MCKEEQHLITSIMLGDLVPRSGHQFVYGWYLRHAIRAGILLRLMGRTEGLACQRGTSTHFSYQVSEVPPVNLLLHPTSQFCHHLSMATESPGIWRRERECQLALAFLTNRFFLNTKTLDNQLPIPLCHNVGGSGFAVAPHSMCGKWGKRSASVAPAGARPRAPACT